MQSFLFRLKGSFQVVSLRRLFTTVALASIVIAAAQASAKADPLTFSNVQALQNNGASRIDLLSNPGVTLFGPQVTFLVDIEGMVPPGESTLLITYTEAGSPPIVQSFSIPAFDSVPPPYTQLFTITSPGANFSGAPATLTITIITPPGFSYDGGPTQFVTHTYTFNVAQPVPEPATMVLLGTGAAGLWNQRRRQRKRKTNST